MRIGLFVVSLLAGCSLVTDWPSAFTTRSGGSDASSHDDASTGNGSTPLDASASAPEASAPEASTSTDSGPVTEGGAHDAGRQTDAMTACEGSPYVPGKSYALGDVVVVNGVAYLCRASPEACGMPGFEPGTGRAWDQVWAVVVCPSACAGPAYRPGRSYAAHEWVVVDGIAYRCKSGVASNWCGSPNYEPGTGFAWRDAWEVIPCPDA